MVNEQSQDVTGQPVSGKRIMALDLGEKRIGVALSDETHLIARSYAVIDSSSRRADFAQIAEIGHENNVGFLVVGLPVKLSGEEGPIATWVRDYTAELSQKIGIQYALWDESFTTQQASDSMRQRGTRAKEQRDWIDAVAAAFILQDFLDARRDRTSLL